MAAANEASFSSECGSGAKMSTLNYLPEFYSDNGIDKDAFLQLCDAAKINGTFFVPPSNVLSELNIFHRNINQKLISFIFKNLSQPNQVENILWMFKKLQENQFNFKKPVLIFFFL